MDARMLQEKGELAEQFIAELCKNAFQQDFTFKNPYVNGKELCDVLVVLKDIAIIWQIKSLKEKDGTIKDKEVEKAIRQCLGAKRKMSTSSKMVFENIVGNKKTIYASSIKEYHLIVAIEDGIPDAYTFYAEKSNNVINIFFTKFTRFCMKYLNTVPDLVDYLRKKEKFLLDKNIIVSGGEENLLAHFLSNARTFGNMDDSAISSILFDDNLLANKFENREDVKLRLREEQKYGRITDMLIVKKRQSTLVNKSEYVPKEVIDLSISLLLNMNSLEKRVFGKAYYDSTLKAYKVYDQMKLVDGLATYRAYHMVRNVLFLFDFLGFEDEKYKKIRRSDLHYMAYGAVKRLNHDFDYIIGIGTEIDFAKRDYVSFEWAFLDYTNKKKVNDFIDLEFPDIDLLLKKLGVLQNPTTYLFSQNEYDVTGHIIDFDLDIKKYIK